MAGTKKAKADTVTIRLKAKGERSYVTGDVLVHKGGTVDVDKDTAAAAVKGGRWSYVADDAPEGADAPEPNGGEGSEGVQPSDAREGPVTRRGALPAGRG
jgi:hypothetical protein